MNSEAILQKLIESGYINDINKELGLFLFFDEIGDESMFVEDFYSQINKNSPEGNAIALVIQRALFDECANRELTFKVVKNKLLVDKYEDDGDLGTKIIRLHEGDISHESFALAYQKVVGIER